jgi:hypothetical protein
VELQQDFDRANVAIDKLLETMDRILETTDRPASMRPGL